ncbi:hypothetical protein RMATCC62417_13258 [Rhizopus microsporus]|nr:hypothetical protein RMATCC62417_13258 [Rhizopus microsporus]
MYGKGSFPNDSSSSNNQIEPNFFHTSATRHNTPNKKDNSQDHAETPYWQSPPPYSEHANYPPAISDTDNHAPSAPPLELAQGDVIPPYPPQPQVYPPLNYDNNNPHSPTTGYPTYGSFPQPPYHNTPDVLQPASMPSWPWVAPPRLAESSPPPVEDESVKINTSCCERMCKMFWYFITAMVFFVTLTEILGGSTRSVRCDDGINWPKLPKRFDYESILRITVDEGSLTSGKIILKNPAKDTPPGTVLLTGSVSSRIANEISIVLDQKPGESHLKIRVPRQGLYRSCVSLEAVVYVAGETELIQIDVQNSNIHIESEGLDTSILQLSTSNAPIDLDCAWSGKDLKLRTTNGHIRISRPLKAENSVMLVSSNGGIHIDQNIQADQLIAIATTNGPIKLNQIQSDKVLLHTSNGPVSINEAQIGHSLNATTTNDELKFQLLAGTSNPVINGMTTNGRIIANMPADFEGQFDLKTGVSQRITISDQYERSVIKRIGRGFVIGERFNGINGRPANPGSVKLQTTNDNVALYFGNK